MEGESEERGRYRKEGSDIEGGKEEENVEKMKYERK